MLTELSHLLLILASVTAAGLVLVSFLDRREAQANLPMLVRLTWVQAGFSLLSFLGLVWAFVQSDFSVALVETNSHSDKPLIFKISGTWGNHEGSILLWLLMLSIFGCVIAARKVSSADLAKVKWWALSVQSALFVLFALFTIFASNPFVRQFPVPLDGLDLNPLLQDIGLAIHPPLLYAGYVGFSATFAVAAAGLISGRIDRDWAAFIRPIALLAWTFLTGGIALGSWWASYELGWGGWWFWDPVENVSMMPWLTGTALIHSLIALEKSNTLKAWTVFLAVLTFSLSILGTFVVRSGILTSVHAFAVDPQKGIVLLGILVLVVGFAFTLFAMRAPSLRAGRGFDLFSREGWLVFNNLLLCSGATAVFVGTFYPLVIEALDPWLNMGRPSVGTPYFDATFNPLMLILVAAMAVGPLAAWRLGMGLAILRAVLFAIVAGVVVTALVWLLFGKSTLIGLFVVWLGGSMGAAAVLRLARDARASGGILKAPKASYAFVVAHLGLAIGLLGAVGASVWVDEHLVALGPNESTQLDERWTVRLGALEQVERSNHSALVVPVHLESANASITLMPERRQYHVRQEATTELATGRSLSVNLALTDVFATLGQQTDQGKLLVKVVFRPLQVYLWLGAILMALGGVIGLLPASRRERAMSS